MAYSMLNGRVSETLISYLDSIISISVSSSHPFLSATFPLFSEHCHAQEISRRHFTNPMISSYCVSEAPPGTEYMQKKYGTVRCQGNREPS